MKIVTLLVTLVMASPAFCDGLPSGPYIYTVGRARMSVDPDVVFLNATVSAVNLDQGIARATVISQATEVFAVLKATGVPDADISSHEVSVKSEYELEDRKRVFAGYRVSQKIVIILRDVTRLAALSTKLVSGIVSSIEAPMVKYSKQDGIETAVDG
jgi:uncharacterized protein YggE